MDSKQREELARVIRECVEPDGLRIDQLTVNVFFVADAGKAIQDAIRPTQKKAAND